MKSDVTVRFPNHTFPSAEKWVFFTNIPYANKKDTNECHNARNLVKEFKKKRGKH
jgi:hypothetical protein